LVQHIVGYDMASRQKTPIKAVEAEPLRLPAHSDATPGFVAQAGEAPMNQTASDQSQRAVRRLRILLLLATVAGWIGIAITIRLLLL
jgi:hypothetical protein